MAEQFDCLVIGSGPGGYVAAIRAAQLGLKTAIVEKEKTLGGTCLNIGCIPSKALLDSSELYAKANEEFKVHGISAKDLSIDVPAMMKRKEGIVEKLTSGVATLMKGNKITVLSGEASLKDKTTVTVTSSSNDDGGKTNGKVNEKNGEQKEYQATNIILATGSVPVELPFLPFDGKQIVSSTEAIAFDSIPKSLAVIGAGAIGLEMASVWSRLGTEVTVIEIMKDILPGWDSQTSKTLMRELKKQKIGFQMESKVTGYKTTKTAVTLDVETKKGKEQIKAEKVLVAVGRKPFYDGLNLDALGIVLDDRGRVKINDHFQTAVPNIYAIGDLVQGPMLAHKAEEDGVAAAQIIAGKSGHVDYDSVPGVVYTWPEAAMVGRSEEQLKADGVPYKKGSFPFTVNGRAMAMESAGGFVKILAHEKTDRILGAHIVGPWASDLLAELVAVKEIKGSAEDVGLISHSHPTLTEAVKEAALDVNKSAIHKIS